MNFKEEYERVYHNYELCLDTFEKIVILAEESNNIKIAKLVEEALNHLDLTPKIF